MPGIVGYVKSRQNGYGYIEEMASELLVTNYVSKVDSYCDSNISISQVSLSFLGNKKYEYKDVVLYIEGEIYNLSTIISEFDLNAKDFPEVLYQSYVKGILDDVLKIINGYFNSCLYDIKNKKVLLFSDRYGLKLMYWYFKDGCFAFAGEPKAILPLDFVDTEINKGVINQFVDSMYLMGDHTWFKHIKLLNPATILEFDLSNTKLTQRYYWKFKDIEQKELSFDESARRMAELMQGAAKKMYVKSRKCAVPISGGLDSRMILAAINKLDRDNDCYYYTFGANVCDDILIAQEVCDIAKKPHEYFLFGKDYFDVLEKFVWNCDGMLGFADSHGVEFIDAIVEKTNYIFSGWPGDCVCGQTFKLTSRKHDKFSDKRINTEIAEFFYGEYVPNDIQSDFYDTPHFEPHLYINRLRKYSLFGLVNTSAYIEPIYPFMDNDLMDFVFSISDKYRYDNKLYDTSLLIAFPDYYKDVMWERTGVPISKEIKEKAWITRKIQKKWNKYFSKKASTKLMHNYDEDFRVKKNYDRITELLNSKDTLYKSYTNIDFYKTYVVPHMDRKKNYGVYISRVITIEIYLRHLHKRGYLKKMEKVLEGAIQ